ncbi:unnamed protein product [Periconia digitata]|uniref:Uncharacterized protein n=1 Tax=Periconia digitata TaxID=1303443 RepID=A0A9W4UMZ8_9PLEO|nr:unnamed protein product [Periconia digitata]
MPGRYDDYKSNLERSRVAPKQVGYSGWQVAYRLCNKTCSKRRGLVRAICIRRVEAGWNDRTVRADEHLYLNMSYVESKSYKCMSADITANRTSGHPITQLRVAYTRSFLLNRRHIMTPPASF